MSYKTINGKLVKVTKSSKKQQPSFGMMSDEVKKNMKRTLERLEIDDMSTGDRHKAMCELAERNPHKGVKGGDCNVTQCQKAGASCFNPPMNAWYCHKCAYDIHMVAVRRGEEPFIKPEHLHTDFTYKYEGE